jgi:hypothetical protein
MAKKRKRRRSSSLAQHKQAKKVLTPPLLSIGPLSHVFYSRDFLPDLLWVATMLDEHQAADAIHEPLDVIDQFMDYPPEGEKHIVDGRISMFSLVPKEARPEVRAALNSSTPWALSERLAHGLLLYPDCPAAWLFDDWAMSNSIDPEAGINYLKHLVGTYYDREDVGSTRLRMFPISRLIKNQKVLISAAIDSFSLWPKYPTHLSEDEQRQVEASTRAMYNMVGAQIRSPSGETDAWPAHFWRHGWNITTCDFGGAPPPSDEDGPYDGGTHGQPQPTVRDVRDAFTVVFDKLAFNLRAAQGRAEPDLYEPIADEVRFGLGSRLLRLTHRIFTTPDLWDPELTPHLLRPIVDGRIVLAWLIQRDDPALYLRYRDYGLGRRKLFKLHVEDHVEAVGTQEEHAAFLAALEREVNHEIMEEFREVDLGGNFAGIDLRKMAIEANLKSLYDLNYQPLSSEAHGDWTALTRDDLRYCTNPLHGYHRAGRFENRASGLSLEFLPLALGIVSEAITELFQRYDIDVEPLFDEATGEIAAITRS